MGISVILPAYNEEKSLRTAAERTRAALRDLADEFEILVIDDASTDETGAIADALAAEHPEIRVFHNEVNLRQGRSLLRGFREARHDLVIHNGVDCPFDMRDLARMLPLIEDADIVVATRKDRRAYGVYRKAVSIAHTALLNLLFPLKLSDYSFVQLYRREVLASIEVGAESQGFVIPEILIRAHRRGCRIKTIPIDYHEREQGAATSGKLSIILASFRDLLRFWWQMRRSGRDGDK